MKANRIDAPHFTRRRILLAGLASALLPGRAAVAASLSQSIARVKPSVIAVGTFQRTRSPAFAFRGTGFVVGDGTLVATNAHVLPVVLDSQK